MKKPPFVFTPEQQHAAAAETSVWMQRALKMADEETVIQPGPMVAGFLDAAAVILATEWTGDVGALKEAWKDATRGFAMEMLLYAWSQRGDVVPGAAGPQPPGKPGIH